MAEIQVYFDGLCQPMNPGGVACYAFIIKSQDKVLYKEKGIAADPFSKEATNNVAEYTALLKALDWLISNKKEGQPVRVRGDSNLVISQISGKFKVKAKVLIPLFQKAAFLRKKFADISFQWVPREENRDADKLSEEAYNNAIIDDPGLLDRIRR